MEFHSPLPLTLYIHLPWCVRKCPYCDFNSHTLRDTLPEQAYIDALIRDLDNNLPKIWGRRLSSIFIGGGTPSLFSAEAIQQLLSQIHARLPFHPDMEITLEANPGTVEQQRFQGFKQAGINRLSIGLQSLNDTHLKTLGRIHNSQEAQQAIFTTQAVGITNLNTDIMFGLPEQTLEDTLLDLKKTITLQPTHISWYQLTLEPNTVFYKTKPTLPNEDDLCDIQTQGQALLEQAGYQQYEVSAYSQPDKTCQHNLNYWEFGDYLGIGAGAHSKLTDLDKQTAYRQWNVKQPGDYLNPQKPFIAGQKNITTTEMPFEFMLNALRLKAGFSETLFIERTGLTLDTIKPQLDEAITKNLIKHQQQTIVPTLLGYQHLNTLIALFLSAN